MSVFFSLFAIILSLSECKNFLSLLYLSGFMICSVWVRSGPVLPSPVWPSTYKSLASLTLPVGASQLQGRIMLVSVSASHWPLFEWQLMALVAWDSPPGIRVSCVHRIPGSPESLGAVICPEPLHILIFPGSLAISNSSGTPAFVVIPRFLLFLISLQFLAFPSNCAALLYYLLQDLLMSPVSQ